MKLHAPSALEKPVLNPMLGLAFVLSVTLAAGCASKGRPLMPTPAIYQTEPGASALFADTLPERQTPGVELVFITDRAPEPNAESYLPYGEGRSRSLAFGTAMVEMVPNLSWADLTNQSRLSERSRKVNLELGSVTEIGRFPQEPYAIEITAEGMMRSPAVLEQHSQARSRFRALLSDQLRKSPRKEVMLYIHGFNETFETAAFTMGELCHFFGREDVCAMFTWPASASGGFLTSYTTTTESAAYAVTHLAKTILLIAQTPGVERLNLMAHSRGSAVLLSAVRELIIQAVSAGIEPVEALKIHNVVLMAPDIDLDVANQQMQVFISSPDMITRWSSDRLPLAISGRWTIYSSPDDRALLVSRFLFRSRGRVGQLTPAELTADSTKEYAKWGRLDAIVYQGERTDQYGHAYFVSNPKVSSDLIQLIRYDAKPGDPGRPLEKIGPMAWTFPESEASSTGP